MNEDQGLPYNIGLSVKAGAGDHVCLISACREFARRTGNTVYYDNMPDVVAAYHDPMLKFGKSGARFTISPVAAHRQKEPGLFVNYYGTYLATMGLLRKGDDPQIELPVFEKTNAYIVIQPFSNFARNPSTEYIQGIIDTVHKLTGMDIYVIGKASTPRILNNVRYDLLRDGITNLMQIIQNAEFIMCPRSLTAHLAAGYKKKAFVWVPDDGENWHLNYTGWNHFCHRWLEGETYAKEKLQTFLLNNKLI